MSATSIGDMAQHFMTLRQTTQIKSRMNQLAQELSTGRVANLAAHLDGITSQVAALDRDLSALGSFAQVSARVAQTLEMQQLALEQVDRHRQALTEQLLPITTNSSVQTRQDAARAGADAFAVTVNLLNETQSGRSLFAGRATDTPALAGADAMLTDLAAAIGPLTDPADILVVIDTWFDDPAGGFATMGYTGDTGADRTAKVSANDSLSLSARADDPALRAVLKGHAIAAMVDRIGGGWTERTQENLLVEAGNRLLSAGEPLVGLRAGIGAEQGRLAELETERNARSTAFSIARVGLTEADPFETASRLQDVQTQLELHYTMTARLNRLSLVNYL